MMTIRTKELTGDESLLAIQLTKGLRVKSACVIAFWGVSNRENQLNLIVDYGFLNREAKRIQQLTGKKIYAITEFLRL